MTTYLSGYPFESQRKVWYFADLPEEEGPEDSWITKLRNLVIRLFGDTYAYYQDPYVEYAPGDSASLSYTVEQSLLTILDLLHIEIIHRAEVLEYILQNPGLDLVAMYACILTEDEFRHDATITLNLYQDQESDDRYLTIYVRQERYDDDIIARMDRICDEYEPALRGQSGWILLTTDFKSPTS